MSVTESRRLVVVLPSGCTGSWSDIRRILAPHGARPGIRAESHPDHRFPVRARRLRDLARDLAHGVRRRDDVLDLVPSADGAFYAAGGLKARLDLDALAADAYRKARIRWWTWQTQAATGTPQALPWETYLARHRQSPARCPLAEARREFEAQPRVLAMLAVTSRPDVAFALDPFELAGYQAGEVVYTTLCWQRAVLGDAVVTPNGRLLRAESGSLADVLRHLRTASQIVHTLTPDRYLAAAVITRRAERPAAG